MNGFSRIDRPSVLWATSAASLLIAVQIASKACRDALFLAHHGVEHLPLMMGSSAILAVLAVLFVARLFSRHGPKRIVPIALFISGSLFFCEWLLFAWSPKQISILLYLHVATLGAVTISGFWSVISERFDPHTAKRSIATISAGAAFGGVLGGLLADRISAMLGIGPILFTLAALSLIATTMVSRIGTRASGEAQELNAPRSGLNLLRHEPHLQNMGFVVILVGASATLIDYAFKAEAARVIRTETELVSFFALFYTAAGLITFGVQTTFCQKLLKHFGVGLSLSLLPLTVLAGGLIGTAWTKLWSLTIVRGTESALSHSVYRSSYELLYSPVADHLKRPTKTLIDVGCSRLGDVLGALLVVGLIALDASRAVSYSMLAASVAAAITIALVVRVRRGYIATLIRRLRTGALRHSESSLLPGAPRTHSTNDHAALLQSALDPWLERNTADLLVRAMLESDQRLQGTALELLDEMVPISLRQTVSKILESAQREPRTGSSKREKVERLLASMRSLHLESPPPGYTNGIAALPKS